MKYVEKTRDLRLDTGFFIRSIKPHRKVSSDTLSSWIKKILQESGVDTSRFTSHSTRSASSSAATVGNVPINVIMDAVGWTC